jgi:hypothetical protein
VSLVLFLLVVFLYIVLLWVNLPMVWVNILDWSYYSRIFNLITWMIISY